MGTQTKAPRARQRPSGPLPDGRFDPWEPDSRAKIPIDRPGGSREAGPLGNLVRFGARLGLDAFFAFNAARAVDKIDILADREFLEIYRRVFPFTLTTIENAYALFNSVRHLVRHEIPGDFVECGVWRGGSAMTMALALASIGETDRTIRLYDTFDKFPEPTAEDGYAAVPWWVDYFVTSADQVREAMLSTGYPPDRIELIEGRVEDTLPEAPEAPCAMVRLDTDYYSSTLCELEYLYPLLSPGGVLIIDDYGLFAGSRRATHEYFETHDVRMMLHRIDVAARIGVKS